MNQCLSFLPIVVLSCASSPNSLARSWCLHLKNDKEWSPQGRGIPHHGHLCGSHLCTSEVISCVSLPLQRVEGRSSWSSFCPHKHPWEPRLRGTLFPGCRTQHQGELHERQESLRACQGVSVVEISSEQGHRGRNVVALFRVWQMCT